MRGTDPRKSNWEYPKFFSKFATPGSIFFFNKYGVRYGNSLECAVFVYL